jgi:hypothetical protein
MNSYLITPADFLYISQELGHVIELCTPTVTQQSDPTLGFSAGISYTKRKLRGHIIEQKAAIPTATGIIKAVANLVACVSSLDFKISDLNNAVRISYQGELYQVEHQKEYTHQGKSIYHQLKLISGSNFRTHTDIQPDSNLDHLTLTETSAPISPIIPISSEPNFDF